MRRFRFRAEVRLGAAWLLCICYLHILRKVNCLSDGEDILRASGSYFQRDGYSIHRMETTLINPHHCFLAFIQPITSHNQAISDQMCQAVVL